MINRAILLGSVETTPIITALPTGTRVANFVLITKEKWKDSKTGQEKSRPERHKIAVFSDKLIDTITSYVRAGTLLYLEGQIETRGFTDQTGVARTTIDIVIRPIRGTLTILGDEDHEQQPGNESAPLFLGRK